MRRGTDTTNPAYGKLTNYYDSVKDRLSFKPRVVLVLGSGLGDSVEQVEVEDTIDYHDIQGLPVSTVPGHKGRFVFVHINGVPAVMMQGRVYYYEGYPMTNVVLPIRLVKPMGAQILLLTSAAGGVNFDFVAGDFMLIKDQISCFAPSLLIGADLDGPGSRFVGMSHIYDEGPITMIRDTARELDIQPKEGVYIQLAGPVHESPQEVKMCGVLGGDVVGMSIAREAVAANHMGMRICGISCISNLTYGMTDVLLSHEEVQKTSDRVAPLFKKLVWESTGRTGISQLFRKN